MAVDKTPEKSDHGKSIFNHAKGPRRPQDDGKAGGISPHARGLAREHDKQAPPATSWAVSERAAPKKTDTVTGGPYLLGSPIERSRPTPGTAAPGRTELGNPDVHLAPRRRVAGKNGLPLHEEEVPAALRRGRLKGGPHALTAKLSSELKVADAANKKHHSGHEDRADKGADGGKNKTRTSRSPALGGADKPDAAHGRIGSPTDTPGVDGIGYSA